MSLRNNRQLWGLVAIPVIVVGMFIITSKGRVPSTYPPSVDKPNVEILATDWKRNSYLDGYETFVTVRNNTDRLISFVTVTVTFYDDNKRVVGTSPSGALNIAAGAERVVSCMGVSIYNAATYSADITSVSYK